MQFSCCNSKVAGVNNGNILLLLFPFPLIFPQGEDNFTYCPATGLAIGNEHSEFAGWAFPFPGVFLVEEFISEDEECEIVELMDRDDWKPSQSGRKKQVGLWKHI